MRKQNFPSLSPSPTFIPADSICLIFSPTLLPFSLLVCLSVVLFSPLQTSCPFAGLTGYTPKILIATSSLKRFAFATFQKCILSHDHHVSLLTGFSESSPKPWKILFANSQQIIFYIESITSASIQSRTSSFSDKLRTRNLPGLNHVKPLLKDL